ncbi:uncharacterized protein LDX57_005812 [Aspergillus melleus]|uniref:uncharacterized protein n=1 Tax=Aspergillus melleus TaxID=138277 RepID=UPI001E8DB10F|nr:uncharacterized protein LDX57_005812 [Aspergillus melleus]KAH8428107.1 hypothetical protein LDX57_005812 [Aspergillus melleus]
MELMIGNRILTFSCHFCLQKRPTEQSLPDASRDEKAKRKRRRRVEGQQVTSASGIGHVTHFDLEFEIPHRRVVQAPQECSTGTETHGVMQISMVQGDVECV